MPKTKPPVTPVINSAGQPYIYFEQVGHLIRKAHQQASAIFQKYSPEKQLTSVQLAMLTAIATQGAMPQSKLGKLAAIDASTLTGVVERLHDRGLIVLSSEASDKRKVIIDLSEAGKVLVHNMSDVGNQITEATLAPLSPVERVALVMLLKKLTSSEENAA